MARLSQTCRWMIGAIALILLGCQSPALLPPPPHIKLQKGEDCCVIPSEMSRTLRYQIERFLAEHPESNLREITYRFSRFWDERDDLFLERRLGMKRLSSDYKIEIEVELLFEDALSKEIRHEYFRLPSSFFHPPYDTHFQQAVDRLLGEKR